MSHRSYLVSFGLHSIVDLVTLLPKHADAYEALKDDWLMAGLAELLQPLCKYVPEGHTVDLGNFLVVEQVTTSAENHSRQKKRDTHP
jgi:hypothetical protein